MTIKVTDIYKENNIRALGLTEDKTYLIVAVFIDFYHQKLEFNIIDDDGILAIYNQHHFEIVNNKVEEDWILVKGNNNYFKILPQVIAYESFYEDFHNDEPSALEAFDKRFPDLKRWK